MVEEHSNEGIIKKQKEIRIKRKAPKYQAFKL